MSGFVKAFVAPAPQTKQAGYIAILYAGLLTVMVAAQLFTFEDFIVLIGDMFRTPNGMVLAALIVVAEVFSLPFLLRMTLSKAFRYLSLGLSALTAGIWLCVTLWGAVTAQTVTSSGLIGTVESMGPGYWAVCFSIALCALATWSVWGLWPSSRKN